MPKKAESLSAVAVGRLNEPGMYAVGGVPGLHLRLLPSGAKTWILRVMVEGKRADMGLGGFPAVSLADARAAGKDLRQQIASGGNPVAERHAQRAERAAAQTFAQAAEAYITAHAPGWKNAKHAAQWRSTLDTYAMPVLGALLARQIELRHILAVLSPIWETKTETASRLRSRMELVLDWATAHGQREGLNPARWRGHLDKLLPKPSKVAKTQHHAALPVGEVGAFVGRLRQQDGMGARALEFAILTAARSGEVRGATWGEIDLVAGVWAIPGGRMKAGRDHRVPLSGAALALLAGLPRVAGSDLVFQSPRGGPLSDMTLSAVLRRMEVAAVPHGFRSTFRDWAAERTAYPGDLAEMALAHTIGDKVEAAYRRGDMFDKRRRMMEEWASFCATVASSGAEVVPLRRAG
jgi:integrase